MHKKMNDKNFTCTLEKRCREKERERERGWIHVVVISISMLVKVCGKCC